MIDVRSHRDLIVWQKSMDLAVMMYEITKKFPAREAYGLVSQATRAAISVPANIAEGNARGTTKDYAHFLAVAKGSLMETETYVILATRLTYITDDQAKPALHHIIEISKMLTAMRNKLGSRE